MPCLAAERLNVFTIYNVEREFVKNFCASKKKGPFPKTIYASSFNMSVRLANSYDTNKMVSPLFRKN